MSKISDYSISDILRVAGTETKNTGNQIVCRCPVCKCDNKLEKHDCQVNSDKNNIYCFSENKSYSRTELIKELNLYDVLGIKRYDDKETINNTITEKPTPAVVENLLEPSINTEKAKVKETTYEFKNIAGEILYKKRRIDFSNKTKDIKYYKSESQGTVLYGLETLRKPQLDYIIFVEGEKCAEAVKKELVGKPAEQDTAVLSFNSPQAEWKNIGTEAQNIILSKDNIVIFQDNDPAGKQKVSALCDILKKPLKIIDFYDKDAGYDIADWLNTGGTIAEALKTYLKDYTPAPEPDYSQFLINNLIKNIKPVIETSVMSIKIQYQAIAGICGATSAGKTDFVLQVADEHAGLENSISLYLYYEGLPNEIAIRADKKKMRNSNNVFAMNAVTDFNIIKKFIERFKDKKILIITDYIQALAWNLYLADKNKNRNSSALREYMTQIFVEQNKLRVEFENICFLNNYILSNDGMREMRQQISSDPAIALGSVKEDGNVAFQLDYAYTIMFSDDSETWKLGRYNADGTIKKYIKLATAKASRIGIDTGNPVFVWSNGRYELINIENKNNTEAQNDDEKYEF